MNLPRGKVARDKGSSCEGEVTLAPGQSLPRGSSVFAGSCEQALRPQSVVSCQFCDCNKIPKMAKIVYRQIADPRGGKHWDLKA